jgi:hypothetical protein
MISPFGNATILPAAAWNPEPTRRGTFGILSSCLITMSLCIWTAVHLNLPEHKKESEQVKRKVWWLLLGLLAPELVVWSAWRQRSEMKDLSDKMRAMGYMAEEKKMYDRVRGWVGRAWTETRVFLLLEARDWPELARPCQRQEFCRSRVHPWTNVHSWYAVMGGFAFEDTSVEELQFMPGDRQRVFLTSQAVLWLAKNRAGVLPDISRQHIEDKSKSGGLGKFLTCWQTTYFCAQCVFRLSRLYSISLLELNVFAHALWALVLFWVWWDKPQDVREPTLITEQEGLDVCAYFSLKPKDRESGYVALFRRPRREHQQDPLEGHLLKVGIRSRWVACGPCSDAWEVVAPTSIMVTQQRDAVVVTGITNPGSNRILFGPHGRPHLKVLDTCWTITTEKALQGDAGLCILDGRSIRRLVRAHKSARDDADFRDCPAVVDRCADLDWNRLTVLDGASFVPLKDLFSDHSIHLLGTVAGLTIAGGCYGGLHLTAWACQYPSYAETVLWRAATITILATGPFSIMAGLCTCVVATVETVCRDLLRAHPAAVRRPLQAIQRSNDWPIVRRTSAASYQHVKESAGRGLLALCVCWYIFCRAFIVVECFIMLAHLPDTTLEIPRWATYVPHIT